MFQSTATAWRSLWSSLKISRLDHLLPRKKRYKTKPWRLTKNVTSHFDYWHWKFSRERVNEFKSDELSCKCRKLLWWIVSDSPDATVNCILHRAICSRSLIVKRGKFKILSGKIKVDSMFWIHPKPLVMPNTRNFHSPPAVFSSLNFNHCSLHERNLKKCRNELLRLNWAGVEQCIDSVSFFCVMLGLL